MSPMHVPDVDVSDLVAKRGPVTAIPRPVLVWARDVGAQHRDTVIVHGSDADILEALFRAVQEGKALFPECGWIKWLVLRSFMGHPVSPGDEEP